MKVYSGRQYGNNFNSGDEGLFQDANRPRDSYKFKIKPGLQSEKWDMRRTNKNVGTRASELIATATMELSNCYDSSIEGCVYNYPDNFKLKSKYGEPGCMINGEGNIELLEDGVYIIQASSQFIFNLIPHNGYQYMEDMCLLKATDKGERTSQARSQGRVCAANYPNHIDQLSVVYTGWLTVGTVFTVGSSHTYTYEPIKVRENISVQRLS